MMNDDIHTLIDAATKRVERYGLPNADIIAMMEVARVMIGSAVITMANIIDTAPVAMRYGLAAFFAPMSLSRVQVYWDRACMRLYDLNCDAVDFSGEQACVDAMNVISSNLSDPDIVNRALYESVCLHREQAEERLGKEKLAILDERYGGRYV